jgi:fibronectin type 3 domain-containing protein
VKRFVIVLILMAVVLPLPVAGQSSPARLNFDADASVGFGDFLAFAEAFGSDNPIYDIDGNGLVDFQDFLSFSEVFGQAVTPVTTPEFLTGTLTGDHVLTADRDYVLSGAVFVAENARLIIMPGTKLFGEQATNGTLVVSQGGQIFADGLATAPIVFTSDALDQDRGQWGGIIINGRAPINTGSIAFGEGDTGAYGGTDPDDNSGILRYVRVEFAGIEFSPDNELNGIAFQGVGSGTIVDYVQVHFNQDDGIEFFGGTVNAKHLVCTGIRDDSFDWTDGWVGKGQFWVAQQRGDDADQGFESDNEGDNNDATPRSNPTIFNVTLVGDPDGPESDIGFLLREGTAATLGNFIVVGFNDGGLDIDQSATFAQATAGDLNLTSTIFFDNRSGGVGAEADNFRVDSDDVFDIAAWARDASRNNAEVDPMLSNPYSQSFRDFRPMVGSPALSGSVPVTAPPSDGFFDSVDYIGAFDADNDWTARWTTAQQPSGTELEPSAPSNVVASAQSGSSVSVSWGAISDASGYKVQRRAQGFTSFETVGNGITSTSFTDSDLVPGTDYTYRVVAVNNAGSSPASSASTARTTASGTASGNPTILSGTITSDTLLRADQFYLLSGAVFVGDGATLTIEPGTTIFGENVTQGTLIVSQGGKIHANGRADAPIVMTSDAFEGERDRAQWGGLIVNGRAPLNTGATAFGEGDTGQYGGTVSSDDSGVLRYVRVEFAGIEFSPDNELNGIAFQGVGSGTTVDYVQVHFNQDDGVEFFGGTVDAKHLICTGIRDDSFDWTDGWVGRGQFWIAQQRGDDADQGIEADNEGDNNDALPRSNPTIYNATLIGDPDGPESDIGVLVREGTAATLRNFIVTGFNDGGLDIDQSATFTQATMGELSVESSIFWQNGSANFVDDGADDDFNVADWATTAGNVVADPLLRDPFDNVNPDFRPGAGSPATSGVVSVMAPPADGFFEAVDYIGAVDPDSDWTAGWITTEQPAGTVELADADVSGSASSTTAIDISWPTVTDAATHRVERRIQGVSTWSVVSQEQTGTSYSDSGLIPNTDYTYRVVSVGSAGSSSTSEGTTVRTTASAAPNLSGQPETISGAITSDRTLTRDVTYLLSGAVFVRSGATLTIEPGTTIFGENTTQGTLVIDQGGMIHANGRADAPIVFTSDQLTRDRAQWGGLIVNGNAPLNTGTVAFGEGDTGQYGGTDPEDNSGTLRYVRVEFAGIEFSPDNELNGIAFQGVGSGTLVDYVQVHMNQDDGVEFFGGTVDAKHLYCTGIRDDSFDWTDGWVGRGQFWIAQQRGDDADQGIEADNEGDNNDATPRSNPTLFNLTLVGDPNGPESDIGMLLREGTAATIGNSIVIGFNDGGLDIDQAATFTQADMGNLNVTSSIFNSNGSANFVDDGADDSFNVQDWAMSASRNNSTEDPILRAPYSLTSPDYAPLTGSPATSGVVSVTAPPADGFFEAVDYIGAMDPDENWIAGWTTTEQPAASGEAVSPTTLSGEITSDMTLTSDTQYLLSGAVFVRSGATLTIEAGTTIFGENTTQGTLVIDKGAKIMAEGTAAAPIVFTSDQVARDRAQWGGLIINGNAPINTGDVAFGEGDTGEYGGTDPDDNSGTLRYVRVEFAGIEFSPDNELNGIAFQGVGSGTTVEYVQVHYNQDDGIEFFGGTVNAKYLVCTGIRDDSFDWTDGWVGKGQFWIAQQRGDDADQGIEADNEGDNNDATPRSNPTLYNLTLIGDPNGPESDIGMLLREGTGATIANAIVIGFNDGGLDIDQSATFAVATSGDLNVTSSIFYGNGSANFVDDGADDSFNIASWATDASRNNSTANPVLRAPYSQTSPDWRPEMTSPAVDGTVAVTAVPDGDSFFTSVDYVGAIDPMNNWTAGWITTEQPAAQ